MFSRKSSRRGKRGSIEPVKSPEWGALRLSLCSLLSGPRAVYLTSSFGLFFLIFYLFIFRERGKEREGEGEKHQRVVASRALPTGGVWPATQACALTGK